MDGFAVFRNDTSVEPAPTQGVETSSIGLSVDLVESMLDQIPNTSFCVKHVDLRYMNANKAMLDLCGVRSRDDVAGRTCGQFFTETVRARHEALDRQVIRTRRAIEDQLDFIERLRGPAVWALSGRWPVFGPGRRVLGVAMASRILSGANRRDCRFKRVAAVVEHMQSHFSAPLDITGLAERAGISVSRLERDFNDLFGMPPRRYFTKIRLDAALDWLLTDKPIVEVAYACGYPDQAAFSRRFHSVVGMSPSEYRRKHAIR